MESSWVWKRVGTSCTQDKIAILIAIGHSDDLNIEVPVPMHPDCLEINCDVAAATALGPVHIHYLHGIVFKKFGVRTLKIILKKLVSL